MCFYVSYKNPHVIGGFGGLVSYVAGYSVYKIGCSTYSIMIPPTRAKRFGSGAIAGSLAGVYVGGMYIWQNLSELFTGVSIGIWLIFFFGLCSVIGIRPNPEPTSWLGTRCALCGRRWREYWVPEYELPSDAQHNLSGNGFMRALSCDYCGSIRCLACDAPSGKKCPYCRRREARTAWVQWRK
jgi:hypothetical protein